MRAKLTEVKYGYTLNDLYNEIANSGLDTEYREATASVEMKMFNLTKTPLQLVNGTEKEQKLISDIESKELTQVQLKDFLVDVYDIMKDDYQIEEYKSLMRSLGVDIDKVKKENKEKQTESDDIEIINPEEKEYYDDNLYQVDIWSGEGYGLSTFRVYADGVQRAIELVVANAELKGYTDLLYTFDELYDLVINYYGEEFSDFIADRAIEDNNYVEFIEEYLGYAYVDATMEGASQPYYINGENLDVKEIKEESAKIMENKDILKDFDVRKEVRSIVDCYINHPTGWWVEDSGIYKYDGKLNGYVSYNGQGVEAPVYNGDYEYLIDLHDYIEDMIDDYYAKIFTKKEIIDSICDYVICEVKFNEE